MASVDVFFDDDLVLHGHVDVDRHIERDNHAHDVDEHHDDTDHLDFVDADPTGPDFDDLDPDDDHHLDDVNADFIPVHALVCRGPAQARSDGS